MLCTATMDAILHLSMFLMVSTQVPPNLSGGHLKWAAWSGRINVCRGRSSQCSSLVSVLDRKPHRCSKTGLSLVVSWRKLEHSSRSRFSTSCFEQINIFLVAFSIYISMLPHPHDLFASTDRSCIEWLVCNTPAVESIQCEAAKGLHSTKHWTMFLWQTFEKCVSNFPAAIEIMY